MLTIIAFALTIVGSINWLTIGLLQYDFIAGIFGYQASVFSRIIYIFFGVACAFLIFKLFKGKGTIAVFSKRNKEDLVKNLEKLGKSKKEKAEIEHRYANANIESAKDIYDYEVHRHEDFEQAKNFRPPHDNYSDSSSAPRSMFDEHFDDRDSRDV